MINYKHPLYKTWTEIKSRTSRTGKKAILSGYRSPGRTIDMDLVWRSTFHCFVSYVEAELGPKPTPDHSLDRIDNERGYHPGNIRWADKKTQARNTRRSASASLRRTLGNGDSELRALIGM